MKITFILFQKPNEKAYLASYVIWSWISAWQVNYTSYTPFDQIRHTCYNYYVTLKKKNLLDFITQKYNPIYICYNCKCYDPDEILVMLRQNSLTAIWVGHWDSGTVGHSYVRFWAEDDILVRITLQIWIEYPDITYAIAFTLSSLRYQARGVKRKCDTVRGRDSWPTFSCSRNHVIASYLGYILEQYPFLKTIFQ